MRSPIALAIAASLFIPVAAAAQICPDMSSVAISAPAADSAKCLAAVAKASSKFVSSKLKAQDKCRKTRTPGACVDTTPFATFATETRDQKTTDSILKAMTKAADTMAKKCEPAALAGFANTYSTLTTADMASCMLGQNNVSAALMSWNNNGASAPVLEIGACSGGSRPGEACADDSACSGICVGGDDDGASCLGDAECTNGGVCNPGTCVLPVAYLKKCVDTFASAATKYASSALKTINKCVSTAIKDGVATDIEDVCIGTWSGGVYTLPSDAKTAGKLADAQAKAFASVDDSCGPGLLSADAIESMNACGGGASSVADLKECLLCNNWSHVLDVVAQQYSEGGTFVARTTGIGELQAAWDAASSNDKYLVESGVYTSDPGDGGVDDPIIKMTQAGVCVGGDTPGAQCSNDGDCPGVGATCDAPSPTGVQFVGCVDTTTGARPRLERDAAPNNHNRGVDAASIDGLEFQSFEVFDWTGDGMFVTDAEGVTFRDIVGDGGDCDVDCSTYAVFPVSSDDVLVENCFVTHVDDAGIYVGSSTNYTVRYNMVTDSVAGIEVENSINADTHNNESFGNTGGLLTFMLVGPPLQASFDHDIHHNVLVSNNTPNFGSGTVGNVPTGTGMLIISTDTSEFHHNYIEDNGSSAISVINQIVLSAISGDPGDCCSPSQNTFDNHYYANVAVSNALDLDPGVVGIYPEGTQNVMILGGQPVGTSDNCWEDNVFILPPSVNASNAQLLSPPNDCTPGP